MSNPNTFRSALSKSSSINELVDELCSTIVQPNVSELASVLGDGLKSDLGGDALERAGMMAPGKRDTRWAGDSHRLDENHAAAKVRQPRHFALLVH